MGKASRIKGERRAAEARDDHRRFMSSLKPVDMSALAKFEAEFIRKNTLIASKIAGRFFRRENRLCLVWPHRETGQFAFKFADELPG